MPSRSLPMSERVTRHLQDLAKKLGGGSVEVGFMEGATYPDGTPVAAVAFWNEFGHKGPFPAPARSFFRTMIAKESPRWPDKMAALLKATGGDGPRVLAFMGEEIDGQLKDSIIATNAPPLSPTTLRLRYKFGNNPQKITVMDVLAAQAAVAKGRKNLGMASGSQAKPLVWTGHLLQSTAYRVKEGTFQQNKHGDYVKVS